MPLSQGDNFSSGSDVGNLMCCQVISEDQASLLTHTSISSLSPDSDQSISTPNPIPDLGDDLDELDVLLSEYQQVYSHPNIKFF